jgi:hypothetical protein
MFSNFKPRPEAAIRRSEMCELKCQWKSNFSSIWTVDEEKFLVNGESSLTNKIVFKSPEIVCSESSTLSTLPTSARG